MKIRLTIFLFLSFIIVFARCDHAESRRRQKIDKERAALAHQFGKVAFDVIIDSIDHSVGTLITPISLRNIETFNVLYDNPELFVDSVLQFLANPNNWWQKKHIANYTLQKLNEQKYIEYIAKAALLYKKGLVSEDLMKEVLYSEIPPNRTVYKNFDDRKVITALNEIKNVPGTSVNLKQDIDKTLAGDDR